MLYADYPTWPTGRNIDAAWRQLVSSQCGQEGRSAPGLEARGQLPSNSTHFNQTHGQATSALLQLPGQPRRRAPHLS